MYAITGGSHGLGLALAQQLAAAGETVISLSRTPPKGEGIGHIACDLTNEGSINAAAKALLKNKEPLHALVNCAGMYSRQKLSTLTGPDLARMYTTNVIGPTLLTARLLERIKKDGSDIVNVASSSAFASGVGEAAYASSKWAMRGFSQNLQVELKQNPSRVISFCPDSINTNDTPDGAQTGMGSDELAAFLLQLLRLPKNIEVSEVRVRHKP